MSSQAQIDANRENARLSTGPSSPEGSAASAQNARVHGFSSQHTVVPPERQAAFQAFKDALCSQIQPHGALEDFLVRRIVHAAWNLDQLDETEANLFPDPAAFILDDANDKIATRLARYRALNLRVYNQAMRSLQYEQTQRGLRAAASDLAVPPQANLPQINAFAKRTQIHEPLSTFPPEYQDQLHEIGIQTKLLIAQLRHNQEQRRREAAA